VFVLIAKEKAPINSWQYVTTTLKFKSNKRYILLIKCLIATFYATSLGVFAMLVAYKGPVLEFFVQFAVLMVSAFALKLTGSKLPLDLDNPKLAGIEFERVPQGKGGRKFAAALFQLLNINNETYFQQFANALGEAKNLGDSTALRAMLANADTAVPLLMASSGKSLTTNNIHGDASAVDLQGQL
jgi:hypothetical protein